MIRRLRFWVPITAIEIVALYFGWRWVVVVFSLAQLVAAGYIVFASGKKS